MSQTVPSVIAALPAAPSTTSPTTFATLMDAWIAALPAYITSSNSVATTDYNNAVDAYNNAVAALASAAAASASANAAAVSTGVVIWVTGTTYAIGDNRFSPSNLQTYRRKTAGAGATDPASDPTNWTLLMTLTMWLRKTTTYTCASNEHIKASTTAAAWSLTFPVTPTDGDEVEVQDVDGTFNTNNLTLLVNGKKIMGYTTSLVLDTQYFHGTFVYDSTLGDWRM